MWKSIIIVSSLLMALGTTNTFAAGLGSGQRETPLDRADRNITFNERMSVDDIVNSLIVSNDMKAGLIFGLNSEEKEAYEGPQDTNKGMGIGIGLSFSF